MYYKNYKQGTYKEKEQNTKWKWTLKFLLSFFVLVKKRNRKYKVNLKRNPSISSQFICAHKEIRQNIQSESQFPRADTETKQKIQS